MTRPIVRVQFVKSVEIRHGGQGLQRMESVSAANESRITMTKVDGGIEFRWGDNAGNQHPHVVLVPAANVAAIEYGPDDAGKPVAKK